MAAQRGLYRKYVIEKVSGRPVDPAAEYFVLRVDKDPAAREALLAYAGACRDTNPTLSDDLLSWVRRFMGDLLASPDPGQGVVERLKAMEGLADALKGFIKDHYDLADSGDMGYFDPEQQPVVTVARKALTTYDKAVGRDG